MHDHSKAPLIGFAREKAAKVCITEKNSGNMSGPIKLT